MNEMIFLAIDADNAGRLVGRAVLADDAEALHDVSNRIDHGQELIINWAQSHGGNRISSGGDEANIQIPREVLSEIEQLRKDYEFATKLTLTIGVGRSLSEAGKALMVGKFRGKNQVVEYDESVESDMAATRQHLIDGTATEEENKIGEAYMNKQQPEDMGAAPLAQAEGAESAAPASDDHSDCPYCQELDGATAHSDDCQYCEEYDAANGAGGDESLDNCPYCQEMHTEAEHTHGDDCVHCQEYDAKQAGAQAPAESAPGQPAQTPDLTPQGAPNESQTTQEGSQEALPAQEVLQQLDEENQEASSQEEVNSQTLNEFSDAPADNGALLDDGMIDGVSRPDGYDENTPGDMGMAEDEVPEESPDLSQVLQGGLDRHASSIQKEKVVDMVSQALEGFKSQKQILEKAKDQAPQLYQSCIMMLKAMIEMTKMLGLNQGQADANDPLGDEASAQPQDDQQQAAPQEGAAQPPKGIRQ